jgi:hypothetical protein
MTIWKPSALWLASALTVTAGCLGECPDAVVVPDQPYTASLRGSGLTLDATPASWNALCEARCGAGHTACAVHVNTCECNGLTTWINCDDVPAQYTNGGGDGFDITAWIAACQSACGAEQNCQMGVDPVKQGEPIVRCQSWYIGCTGY